MGKVLLSNNRRSLKNSLSKCEHLNWTGFSTLSMCTSIVWRRLARAGSVTTTISLLPLRRRRRGDRSCGGAVSSSSSENSMLYLRVTTVPMQLLAAPVRWRSKTIMKYPLWCKPSDPYPPLSTSRLFTRQIWAPIWDARQGVELGLIRPCGHVRMTVHTVLYGNVHNELRRHCIAQDHDDSRNKSNLGVGGQIGFEVESSWFVTNHGWCESPPWKFYTPPK